MVRTSLRFLWIILTLCTLIACSSTGRKPAFDAKADRPELDPLIDAPLRMQTICQGESIFIAGDQLGNFSFICTDLDVTATLNELRDAGWRVEKMNIGKTLKTETSQGTPLSITIRKIY